MVTFSKRKTTAKSDVLVLPFWQAKAKAEPAFSKSVFKEAPPKDFKGKKGECLFVYTKTKRLLFLGLGETTKCQEETLRQSVASIAFACQQKHLKNVSIVFPTIPKIESQAIAKAMVEGILLCNYTFDRYKSKKETHLIEKIGWIGIDQKALKTAKETLCIMQGVHLARDLVNTNADDSAPNELVKQARLLVKKSKALRLQVLDRAKLVREKMGLLLAVSRGSACDPALIVACYEGAPKSKDVTVLVGKGVTYDTGGLNLKPTGYIETMKSDMGGAAAVLGTLSAVADLKLPINVIGVIPATENAVGSKSYKPGDVYTSFSGKTVEIGNTDAEGRLILADAIAWSVKNLKPSRIIDLATLTGAIVITLGEEASGLMSSDDALAKDLEEAGLRTYERVWRLPLFEEYCEQLKSDIADIKNIGGKEAASITAALFLKEFVGKTPWAHLDIAGTAYLTKPRRYHPKNGTGVGVRLLVEYLYQSYSKN